jgi:hypothetical protein
VLGNESCIVAKRSGGTIEPFFSLRSPGEFYVSASATGGTGAIDDPYDLTTALRVGIPGDIFYLRAGTYASVTAAPNGTLGNPVTYRNYPAERVIIDGLIASSGQYVRWQGIEIDDTTSFAGGRTSDWPTSQGTTGVAISEGVELINCIIKNHQQGMAGGVATNNYTVYGCLIYYNGLDNGNGHGAYCQHDNIAGYARFERNLVFSNFGYGLHLYGSAALRNFIVDDNIAFHNGSPRNTPERNILLGGYAGTYLSQVTNNLLYHQMLVAQNMTIGWGSGNIVQDVDIIDNVSVQGQTAFLGTDLDYGTVTIQDNELFGSFLENVTGVGQKSLVADYPNNTLGDFDDWTDAVYVASNAYDADRAQVVVYNKSAADTVQVDVSAVFGQTGTVLVHNCQDYWVDIQTLTITAGVITIDMQAAARTIETPVGWAAPETTFPIFGCFIVRKA